MALMNIPFTLNELQKIGLKQAAIAAALGVTQPTVSALKNGKDGVTRPSGKVESGLKRLARKHRIPTEPPT